MGERAQSTGRKCDLIESLESQPLSGLVLDGFAAPGPQGAPATERFLIQINIGDDRPLVFNKSIRPLEPGEFDPDDSGPDTDTAPQEEWLPIIASKKSQDGGSGEPL